MLLADEMMVSDVPERCCFFCAASRGRAPTHPVALAVVVACVRVEGAQVHPAETHFVLGVVEEAADVGAGLQGNSSSVLTGSDSACFCLRPLTLGGASGGSGTVELT